MVRYEYMRLKLTDMPTNVIEHYKLLDVATPDGYVYCKIRKGMYRLPQAGIIAQELLAKRLKEHGYSQSKTTPGLWKHEWHPIIFSLVIDDFGVKYVGEEHAQHLLKTIQKYYQCSVKQEGEQYCGLTIKWDYPNKKVHILMPKYIENGLKRFQHPPPIVKQDKPHPHVHKTYGAKVQYTKEPDDSVPLDKLGKKFIQEVNGVFLFLARAVDSTMLTPLSALASEQAAPTEKNDAKMSTIFGLRSITGQSHRILPCKRHETRNPQRRVLPLGTKGSQQSRRPRVHGRLGGNTHQQRSGIKHLANYKSSDVIGRRG